MQTILSRFIPLIISTFHAACLLGQSPSEHTAPREAWITKNIDDKVTPGDNFYKHALGKWMGQAEAKITPDQDSVSFGTEMNESCENAIRDLLTNTSYKGANAKLIRDSYAMLVQDQRGKGYAPIRSVLNMIRSISTPLDGAKILGRLHRMGFETGWSFSIEPYDLDATQMSMGIEKGTLSIKGAGYYVDGKHGSAKKELTTLIANALVSSSLASTPEVAIEEAENILATETLIASAIIKMNSTPDSSARKALSLAELRGELPSIPFEGYFLGARIGKNPLISINNSESIKPINRLFEPGNLHTLRALFTWSVIREMAPFLDSSIANAHFAFFQTTLKGVVDPQPKEARAVATLKKHLGIQIAQEFARHYAEREKVAAVADLAEKIKVGLASQFAESTWLSPGAKQTAIQKINRTVVSIGFPKAYPSIRGLHIVRDAPIATNMLKIKGHFMSLALKQVGQKTDREQWPFEMAQYALIPTAMAEPKRNIIIIGIMLIQDPMFSLNNDLAANFGGLGCAIGHEIGHLFDREGWLYDENGCRRNWFSERDESVFLAKTNHLKEQVGSYETLPGLFADPDMSIRETMADELGVEMAYKAMKLAIPNAAKDSSREFPELSRAQAFFYAYAHSYRMYEREDSFRNSLLTDPHGPCEIAVNGPLSNLDGFYEAFPIQSGDRMFRPESRRLRVW